MPLLFYHAHVHLVCSMLLAASTGHAECSAGGRFPACPVSEESAGRYFTLSMTCGMSLESFCLAKKCGSAMPLLVHWAELEAAAFFKHKKDLLTEAERVYRRHGPGRQAVYTCRDAS